MISTHRLKPTITRLTERELDAIERAAATIGDPPPGPAGYCLAYVPRLLAEISILSDHLSSCWLLLEAHAADFEARCRRPDPHDCASRNIAAQIRAAIAHQRGKTTNGRQS